MTQLRVSEVAQLLGVSDDTVRRWVDQGRLAAQPDRAGRMVLEGAEVAAFARAQGYREGGGAGEAPATSARNRLPGIVTDVQRDGLVAVVELQAGPFRLVSLMTREAADELGLAAGSRATAVVKATTVIVEATDRPSGRP